jgi:hypothetical protein
MPKNEPESSSTTPEGYAPPVFTRNLAATLSVMPFFNSKIVPAPPPNPAVADVAPYRSPPRANNELLGKIGLFVLVLRGKL